MNKDFFGPNTENFDYCGTPGNLMNGHFADPEQNDGTGESDTADGTGGGTAAP